MHSSRLAGAAIACAFGLCACSTLPGSVPGAAGNGSALLDAVKSIAANCSGAFNANLTFAPPLPPSGSLVVNQTCGTSPPLAAAPKPVAAQP